MSATPARPFDLAELLRTLAEHGVEVLVIGGVAVQVHGHRRTTRDLDVIPEPSPANLDRLAEALVALDAHPQDLPGGSPTREQLQTAPVVPPLITRQGVLHVLRDVPGAADYGQLRRRALELDLDGVTVLVVGLEDLIAMKRASGRPQDLTDLAVLTG